MNPLKTTLALLLSLFLLSGCASLPLSEPGHGTLGERLIRLEDAWRNEGLTDDEFRDTLKDEIEAAKGDLLGWKEGLGALLTGGGLLTWLRNNSRKRGDHLPQVDKGIPA